MPTTREINQINRQLSRLCTQLNRKSLNYSASIRLFKCEDSADLSPENAAQTLFGDTCRLWPDATSHVDLSAVIAELSDAVAFTGDEGSHPNPNYRDSQACRQSVAEITSWVNETFGESGAIFSISFREGHPFYPVFWDFAFIFVLHPDAYFFIGSSSD